MAATPSLADGADGRWFLEKDGVEICPRTHWSDDAGLTISGNVWRFAESQCYATSRNQMLSLACATEGSEWQAIVKVVVSGNTLTVTEDGTTTTYRRCPTP